MTKTIDRTREKRRGPAHVLNPRTHCVSVRLNDEELKYIDSMRGGMARGEYLRCATFDTIPPTIPEVNKAAWVELSRSASNLNQIAKRLNEININFSENNIDFIKEELDKFRNSLLGISQ